MAGAYTGHPGPRLFERHARSTRPPYKTRPGSAEMTFVILPDHPGAATALPPTGEGRPSILSHPSGRPLIVGTWPADQIVSATVGDTTVALLGVTDTRDEQLSAQLRSVRAIEDLDDLSRTLRGCFHLIASVGGRIRAQGTVSTTCQIFHARLGGLTVAGDDARVLAAVTGAGIDEDVLAMQMLGPYGPPWPLNLTSVWRGIQTVPPGHHLDLNAEGSVRVRRYWSPPEAELPLSIGAPILRAALTGAVRARTGRSGIVSADLSGGLDSTSLCFLAARQSPAALVTTHLASSDPGNEDRTWAGRSAAQLPDATHLVMPMGSTPGLFAESAMTIDEVGDAPLQFMRRPMIEYLADLVSAHGSTLHMQGIGSDELFLPGTMWLPALARRQPLQALTQVRAVKSMRRWTLATTIRAALWHRPYPRWLSEVADGVLTPRVWGAASDWEIAPKLPAWATAATADTVSRQIRQAASAAPEPLAPLPVHHEMLRLTQVNGLAVRSAIRTGARHGVSFQAPFIDDRLIEVAMSIRLADRMRPDQVKPVLAAAMRGIVPNAQLDRRSKGDASSELYVGLRQHRQRLLELFDDSLLAKLGLVDPSGIRAVLRGLHVDARPMLPFEGTLANELWLRAVSNPAAAASPEFTRGVS
ncbi:asparagine synthase-related protein [Micromonospora sp. NPDC048835]|uniref:asparagine synthase-related protein n=1 Tax=Micromonospora sp. NPDC048835 TaxID=3155147 RepID=UPI0033C72B95